MSIMKDLGISSYVQKKDEPYMSSEMMLHFQEILEKYKYELLEEGKRTIENLRSEQESYSDTADKAAQEEEFRLELRARDREHKLIRKIDEALSSIRRKEYGYCEDCGTEIGQKRLEARPTATKCVECKTIQEIREKQTDL